jgi:putative ABC transport system substrate-binding protein
VIARRHFITLVGGAAAWPVLAQAQQAMPVVGFLGSTWAETNVDFMRAFRQSLKDAGYVEGENILIMERWAENQIGRLPELAADLVRRQAAVIATTEGPATAFAAKAATTTIPVVFIISDDPAKLGLVGSIARPGGNVTGVNFVSTELSGKRLELLRELVPGASRVALLVNPANSSVTEGMLQEVLPAARAINLQIEVLKANTSAEIDTAFATMAHGRPDALMVASGPFLTSRRIQLVQLAARHALPATYPGRQYVDVGGLTSYGANLGDAWRQAATQVARILKGGKPADMPVVQTNKFEFVINHQTARTIGLTVPPSLLARADEVIE